MWTLCDYLTSFHGIYILKYLPWFQECLCEIVTVDLSCVSASQYLSMTLPLSPCHRPIRHTCMPFACNQLQYIGRRSMQPLPGWSTVSWMTFQCFFLLVQPGTKQPACPALTHFCRLIPRKLTWRPSPTMDICLRLPWFLVLKKAFEEFGSLSQLH